MTVYRPIRLTDELGREHVARVVAQRDVGAAKDGRRLLVVLEKANGARYRTYVSSREFYHAIAAGRTGQ